MLHAARNARRVLVLPLILNAAGHVKMEIPEAIEHAREHCPGTEFLYGPHLTACDPILDVLRRNLRKCMSELDMPDPTTTGVVLLGRGSSNPQANGDVAKMARWLMEETDHELVDLAFTGITWPRLERAVQRQVMLGMKQVVVLPYYPASPARSCSALPARWITCASSTRRCGLPSLRTSGLRRKSLPCWSSAWPTCARACPTPKLPCDGCKYREIAHDLGHGHSHEHTHAHNLLRLRRRWCICTGHGPQPCKPTAHERATTHSHGVPTPHENSTINTVTEQLTRAGQAIEHDSFAIIDAEVQGHSYTPSSGP